MCFEFQKFNYAPLYSSMNSEETDNDNTIRATTKNLNKQTRNVCGDKVRHSKVFS